MEHFFQLLLFAAALGGSITHGIAPHYAPGVMERVARHRGMERVGCMVSSPVDPLGTWLYVYGISTKMLLHCRVTDVSHPRDMARHLRTGRIVEIDFQSAATLCGSTRERPERCPVVVVRLSE